jgi:hypothetical protein
MILVLIPFLSNIVLFKSKSIIIHTAEKFLNAIKEGDKELIIAYSNADINDFNDEINDLLKIGNNNIHEIINSWFGSNGTRILDDIIGIGNRIGNNAFYQLMAYKIINLKETEDKAFVRVKLIKLKSYIDIELLKVNNIWIVDYKRYRKDFDTIILGNTVEKLLDLMNLNGLF